MPNLVSREVLELVGHGKYPINPFSNHGYLHPIIAPSEVRSRVSKTNQAGITNELLEFPGLSAINKLFSTPLLVGPYNVVEISSNKRRQFLINQLGYLGPKHPSLLILSARKHA